MNRLMFLTILVVTTSEYLVRVGLLPRVLKFLPEIFSAIIVLYVIIVGARDRFRFVRPAYWFTFSAIAVTMLCGILANAVETGPVIAGLRVYLRAIPFFFVGAVYAFSDRQIRSQLRLLLLVCLVQIPIAIGQRMDTMARGGTTGDETSGTLLGSGILSIFLICSACVLTATFLRKRISLIAYLVLFLLILIPTTINETKATVFFLPLGLLVIFLVLSKRGARFKNLIVASCMLAIFGSIFIPIYDYFVSDQQYGVTVGEFFSDKDRMGDYMSRASGVGAEKAGRGDSLIIPLREMSKEPTHFAFGLGIGNASRSSMGEQFTGEYFPTYEPFLQTSASVFILEIGMLGLALVLTLYYLIYKDSRSVATADHGITGWLAGGWAGVIAVIGVATFYAGLVLMPSISYLFWYFSGLIAAQRMRLAQERT